MAIQPLNFNGSTWSVLDQFETEMRLWNEDAPDIAEATIADATIYDPYGFENGDEQ